MMNFKLFREYHEGNIINESIFDKMFSWMNKIGQMYKDPTVIQKAVESVITTAGDKSLKTFVPKTVAVKETYFIMLGDIKNPATNFSMSLTKLADLQDDTGLFQISGTTNVEMLKALTGTNAIEDLLKENILAIVSNVSLVKGKPITMKILKNILPQGKDYVSKFNVTGIASGIEVEKIFNKN